LVVTLWRAPRARAHDQENCPQEWNFEWRAAAAGLKLLAAARPSGPIQWARGDV